MDFGPVIYNTTSHPKRLEISNLGDFPFTYTLFDLNESPPPADRPITPTKGDKKGGKGDKMGAKNVAPAG